MSDKGKTFVAPVSKAAKSKRPSTVSVTSTVRKLPSTSKEKTLARTKVNKNTTILGDADITMAKPDVLPEFDAVYRQIAYGKFMRTMLEKCLVDEKVEREKTEMDIQMAQLADRFSKTMDHLEKTNRRLKEISFVVEQKRLLDLKSNDVAQFHEMAKNSNAQSILRDLAATEQIYLDKLETKNVDTGYDEESGHVKLLDAVNDAIEGLEEIKKHSNLDLPKFKEYEKTQAYLTNLDKEKSNLKSLRSDFEDKFPTFSERLLKEASEKIALMLDDDDELDDEVADEVDDNDND